MYTFLSFFETQTPAVAANGPPVLLAFQGGDKFALDAYSIANGELSLVDTKIGYHNTDFSAIRKTPSGIVSVDFDGVLQILRF